METQTLLFTVGIFIFMVTVYGSVMAGGAALKRSQIENLADDTKFVVNDDGYEVLAGADPVPSSGRPPDTYTTRVPE